MSGVRPSVAALLASGPASLAVAVVITTLVVAGHRTAVAVRPTRRLVS